MIEVEKNSAGPDKPALYRDLGVTEMWRLDLHRHRGTLQAEILDLQAPGGPETLREASAVLPLRTPDFICTAIELAVDARLPELDRQDAREAEADADDTAQP